MHEPVKGKWRVRWDVETKEDGSASYMEEELSHRPDAEEIRSLVSQWYNANTDARILSGFEYDGQPVWLSRRKPVQLQRRPTTLPYRRTAKTCP